jgi:hypothetical protein
MKARILVMLVAAFSIQATAQSVLFNFDNLPVYSPLPIYDVQSGITAQLTTTGAGYSIQSMTTATVVPVGFSGNFIFPNGSGDLLVNFNRPLTAFSILYATQELACDDSATMRVTAYMNTTLVGTSTTNSTSLCVCTWTANTLRTTATQAFNRVVVHYDSKPPTCADWGPIFLADNMTVTPMPPIILSYPAKQTNGAFRFNFTNTPNWPFTVMGTTNLTLPFSNWATVTGLTETLPGQFQFVDALATNSSHKFYRVTSP